MLPRIALRSMPPHAGVRHASSVALAGVSPFPAQIRLSAAAAPRGSTQAWRSSLHAATPARVRIPGMRSYRHMARDADDAAAAPAARPQSPAAAAESAAPGPGKARSAAPSSPAAPTRPGPAADVTAHAELSVKEQRAKDWSIVKKLVGHIWPRGDSGTKGRVVLALALLVGGKVRTSGGCTNARTTDPPRSCSTCRSRSSSRASSTRSRRSRARRST